MIDLKVTAPFDTRPYSSTTWTYDQLAVPKKHFPTSCHALDYIMNTFPIVKRKDESAHGHYRTKNGIFEIYDAMAAATRTGTPYQTSLTPPPPPGPPAGGSGNFIPIVK